MGVNTHRQARRIGQHFMKDQPKQHTEKVGRRGLEPRTYGLKVRSSTIELATRRAHKHALQVN